MRALATHALAASSLLLLLSCGGSDDSVAPTGPASASGADFETIVAEGRSKALAIAAPSQSRWSAVTPLTLVPSAAAGLPNGKVLLWSADDRFGFSGGGTQTFSTLYDPLTNTASDRTVSDTGHNMFCSGTSNLADGRLLVVGGSGESLSSVYNPVTNSWTRGGNLVIPRAYNANTTLADGSVLTLGGSWDGGVGGKDGEVWTDGGGWRKLSGVPAGPFSVPNTGGWITDSHMWLIPTGNGKVFHAGPGQAMHWIDTRGNGAVQPAGPRADDQFSILGNTVMYDTGKVLKTGGAINNEGAPSNKLSYVIDLNTGVSVRKIAPMAYARAFHNSVVLPTGQVVVIGGQTVAAAFSDTNSVLIPELFDPVTESFTPMPAMSVPRNYHSVALLLPDGRVMSSGGGLCGAGCGANHGDIQILSPSYLFKPDGSAATRPVIQSAPTQAPYGSVMTVTTDSAITSFAIVRVSSTTHTVNNDQRRLSLNFTSTGANTYAVDVPSNPGWAVPGAYMLFAMNADGTPSVAKFVTINGTGLPKLTTPDDQTSLLGNSSSVDLTVQAAANGGGAPMFSAQGLPDGLTIHAGTGTVSGTPTRAGTYAVTVFAANASGQVGSQFTWVVNSTAGVRYVRLVATSSMVAGMPYASIAELNLLDAQGAVMSRNGWSVSVDSAELVAEAGAASNAIDGNPATYWLTQWAGGAPGYPHTFTVDLGSPRTISGLKQVPRNFDDRTVINGYTVYTSPDGVVWRNPVANGNFLDLGAPYQEKTIYFDNVARGKTATQSSDHGGVAVAGRALDGNVDGNWGANSVSHTLGGLNDWWEVDLGASNAIHHIRLWNRTDCCAERLGNFTVMLSNTPMTGRTYANLLADAGVQKLAYTGTAARVTTFAVSGTARYVRVQLAGTNVLSLAEVEVFGTRATNNPPVLATPTAPFTSVGTPTSLGLSASDPDGDTLTFTVGGLPPGLTYNPGSGMIAGVPTTAGNYTVTATVSDGRGSSAQLNFAWPVQQPVNVDPIAAPAIVAGSTAGYTIGANGSYQYSWDYGDGSAVTPYGSATTASHDYASPGLYTVTLSIRSADGSITTRSFIQAVTGGTTTGRASASSNIALERRSGASDRLWIVNPDTDTVSVIDTANNTRVAEIAVGTQPRSLAINGTRVVVANKQSASLSVLSTTGLAVTATIALPRGSQPHGVVMAADGSSYVALEASGRLLKYSAANALLGDVEAPGVRHLALSADGARLLASRFVSAPQNGEGTVVVPTANVGAEVREYAPATLALVRSFALRISDKADSTLQGRGLPNYLGAPALSPDGASAWVPSKQDNIQRGSLRDGVPLDFQNTVRAISSRIDLATNAEDYAGRVDHDNSSVASAALYHPNGAYLFVALETSREVAVLDAARKRELIRFPVGRAPQGLAVSTDGSKLYVHNFMDRSVGVVDLSRLLQYGERGLTTSTNVATIASEKLAPNVLLGKRLFYDAKDTRLARDAYMSCASCHNDGGHDGRVWDLTSLGEGLRNTIALRGRAGMGQGFSHWSANFDEVQDFEGQIRTLAGGSGLMSDAAFNTGTRRLPLGDMKAGLSTDLDALAAYAASLNTFAVSPHRSADGTLSAAAQAGKTVFQAKNCAQCHSGTAFTASADAASLKNIGTIKASSGSRLGGPLTGVDIPTLRDVWATAPYLHDGSAATLDAAVSAHNNVALTTAELTSVVSYLREIGSDEASAPGSTSIVSGTSPLYGTATGGTAFTDAGTLPLIGVNIRAGWWLDSIQGVTSAGPLPVHGGDGGAAASFSVPAGQYLVRIHGSAGGTSIGKISFVTNTGQVFGPYGSNQGQSTNVSFDYTVPAGTQITGFTGSVGSYVQRLGVVYGAISNNGASNVALGRTATQSSTGWGGLASRAVDGNTDGNYGNNSVSHTGDMNQPWWEVDLGASRTLNTVTLMNRTDCCAERLSNFYVLTSEAPMQGRTLAQLLADTAVRRTLYAGVAPTTTPLAMNGITGRYVRVQLAGTNYLQLAEVQVIGF